MQHFNQTDFKNCKFYSKNEGGIIDQFDPFELSTENCMKSRTNNSLYFYQSKPMQAVYITKLGDDDTYLIHQISDGENTAWAEFKPDRGDLKNFLEECFKKYVA